MPENMPLGSDGGDFLFVFGAIFGLILFTEKPVLEEVWDGEVQLVDVRCRQGYKCQYINSDELKYKIG